MIKILIVDDDIATVEVIQKSVDWEKVNIDEVYIAYDAMSAKKILAETEIDIVVSDIEMPQESGIELLKWVRDSKMECEFLLLTCHENFDYATNAINYSAAAYLVKPFDINIMELNLQKITVKLKQKRSMKTSSDYGIWMEKNIRFVKQNFWKNLLDGEMTDKKHIISEIEQRHLGINPQADFAIIYSKLTNMETDIEKYTKGIFEFVLEGMFSEVLTGKVENENVIKYHYDDTLAFVTVIEYEDKEICHEKCRQLMDTCKIYFKSTVTMCISKKYEISELPEAIFRLKKQFDYNIAGFGKIFYEEDILTLENGEMQILDLAKMKKLLEEKDKGGILQYLKQVFDELTSLKKLNLHTLYLMKQEINQVFYADLMQKGILATKLFYDDLSVKMAGHAMDSKIDMIRWVNYMMEKTFVYEEEIAKAATIIDKIQEFISKNYQKEIGKNEIAAEFFLAPDYMAKLYKKKTGKNLKDYISEYRIERAKELLKNSDKTISDVASAVGFENFSYFSTIFKKVTGISPTEYKIK